MLNRRQTIAAAGLALLAPARAASYMLTPQTTAGPFYFDAGMVRSDITEGRPGTPLSLALAVTGADCTPLEGARVDLWHCDAMGGYSGVSNDHSERFLRGTQVADATGRTAFNTIYPGWYGGRATHIHARIFLGERAVFTGQIHFPDAVSDAVYAASAAYRPGAGRLRNEEDGIARRLGAPGIAAIEDHGSRLAAAFAFSVTA